MRIWLVQTGEEMPSDGRGTRLLRTALLAQVLTDRGHEVLYWNATFNHQKKIQRYNQTTRLQQDGGYNSIFLYGRAYTKNVSLSRILSQRENASHFEREALKEQVPDIILCGFPTIELAEAVAEYASKHGIPFCIDARDMWPDIFTDHLNEFSRLLAIPIIQYWSSKRKSAFSKATALTGITNEFTQWAAECAGRSIGRQDKAFHLSASKAEISTQDMDKAHSLWSMQLGELHENAIICCFAGTLSSRIDLQTILDAADLFSPEERDKFRIILCGNGDMKLAIEEAASHSPILSFGGWRNRAELTALMQLSHIGLLPYPNTSDFRASFPNKIGEYLSAGLPVLTGLTGATERLLMPHGLKIAYEQGNPLSIVESLRSYANFDRKNELRERALELAEVYFNPDQIYPAFAKWLEDISQNERVLV